MMHDKQHAGLSTFPAARALLCGVFLLGSSACALLANLGGPAEGGPEGARPGSRSPDPALETPQGKSGGSSACSADKANDSSNCGFCGHDCGGAACKTGLCAPTTITTATDVLALATDGDSLFIASKQDVRSCAASPGAVSASVADPAVVAGAVMRWVGGSSGFASGSVRRGNPGEDPTGGILPSIQDVRALQPRGLALFKNRFFVADATNATVFACPKAGCSRSTIGTVRPRAQPEFAGGLAVSGTSIQWGETDGIGDAALPDPHTFVNGEIFRSSLTHDVAHIELSNPAGGDDILYRSSEGVFALPFAAPAVPTEILPGGVADFAFNTHFAYVATKSSVVRVEPTTRERLVLPDLPGEELAKIVADPAGVYATTKGGSSQRLIRVRQDGVDALAVAEEIGAIALSSKWLYYASKGAILRVAR